MEETMLYDKQFLSEALENSGYKNSENNITKLSNGLLEGKNYYYKIVDLYEDKILNSLLTEAFNLLEMSDSEFEIKINESDDQYVKSICNIFDIILEYTSPILKESVQFYNTINESISDWFNNIENKKIASRTRSAGEQTRRSKYETDAGVAEQERGNINGRMNATKQKLDSLGKDNIRLADERAKNTYNKKAAAKKRGEIFKTMMHRAVHPNWRTNDEYNKNRSIASNPNATTEEREAAKKRMAEINMGKKGFIGGAKNFFGSIGTGISDMYSQTRSGQRKIAKNNAIKQNAEVTKKFYDNQQADLARRREEALNSMKTGTQQPQGTGTAPTKTQGTGTDTPKPQQPNRKKNQGSTPSTSTTGTKPSENKPKTVTESFKYSDYELYKILQNSGYKTTNKNLIILKEGLQTGKYII